MPTQPTTRAIYAGGLILLAAVLLHQALGPSAPAAAAPADTLQRVDPAAVRAAHALPLPQLPEAVRATAPTNTIARAAGPDQPAPGDVTLIDDFEADTWPDPERWPFVADLDEDAGGTYLWAPRVCHASNGTQALWAIGGGEDGAALGCGASYPAATSSSAVLLLDLTADHSAAVLDLVFDVWADAAPTEGLFINYLALDENGDVTERRTVYSATGEARAWAKDIRLDLTDLRDTLDPDWQLDLRGRRAYLEWLFMSVDAAGEHEGIWLDDLRLARTAPTPIPVPPDTPTPTTVPPTTTPPPATATPAPTPADDTIGCTGRSGCGTLMVRGYVDYRCDGRYQAGVDRPLAEQPHVSVTAGSVQLGTALSTTGSAYFRVPTRNGATVELTLPSGYNICPGSANPRTLSASDFAPRGSERVEFRVQEVR